MARFEIIKGEVRESEFGPVTMWRVTDNGKAMPNIAPMSRESAAGWARELNESVNDPDYNKRAIQKMNEAAW